MTGPDWGVGSGFPDPSHPLTTRDFQHLTTAIRGLTTEVSELRSEMKDTYARKDVVEPRFADLESDVEKHGRHWEWLVRLVIGAVILALIGVLFAQSGGVP